MRINITREVSVAKAKRKCSKCRSEIPPKDFHLKTTEYPTNNYPIRKNWCKKCSIRYLECLKDTTESMISSIRLNEHQKPLKIDPIVMGEFL